MYCSAKFETKDWNLIENLRKWILIIMIQLRIILGKGGFRKKNISSQVSFKNTLKS